MFNKTLLLSALTLCLVAFSSCDDDPCGFDFSGTYTFESSTCAVNNHPQTVTISNSATEFTFEASSLIISDCEATAEAGASYRKVSFDEDGFDFEGEFEIDNVSVNCEGRYTKN
jgi:hypothetical protein